MHFTATRRIPPASYALKNTSFNCSAERYERADEFVDVVKKLWYSIDEEALIIDKESGRYYDLDKVNEVNHEGKFFKLKGTLDSPSTPQGHPVIVQAGSSEAGKELAAKTAEVIFTAWQTLEDAQAFYRDVKGRLAKYGRDPEDLKILPGAFIVVAETEEEAIEKVNSCFSKFNQST